MKTHINEFKDYLFHKYIKTTSVKYFIIQYVHQKYLCEDFRLILMVIKSITARNFNVIMITVSIFKYKLTRTCNNIVPVVQHVGRYRI